jgi:hypothetical protein
MVKGEKSGIYFCVPQCARNWPMLPGTNMTSRGTRTCLLQLCIHREKGIRPGLHDLYYSAIEDGDPRFRARTAHPELAKTEVYMYPGFLD